MYNNDPGCVNIHTAGVIVNKNGLPRPLRGLAMTGYIKPIL